MISPFKIAIALTITSLISGLSLSADEKITFVDNVKPIFQKRCAACHNGNRQSGGLDLTNYTNMMQGGSSGGSIEPGDADGSYLYQLVIHEESPEMPPNGNKIPEAEISVLKKWIDAGALESKTSVATTKKKKSFAMTSPVGVRPEQVAYPWRMSLQPYFQSKQPGLANTIATSPWAPLIAISGSKQILLYDSNTFQLVGFLPLPEGKANDLKFSRDGSLLIAGGGRHGLTGKIIAWDVQTAQRLFEIGDELDNVLAADISANLKLVALGGPQKMLRVYSTGSEALRYEIKKHTDWITNIEFSPDGVLLASADRNGGLQLWESESGNEYLTLGGHDKSINGISWRSDSNVVATCSDDGTVKLWEVENGRQIKSWSAHNSVAEVAFTRDGKLVTTGRDRKIKLWQQDGKLIREFKGLGEIGISIDFCNETNRIFASNYAGKVRAWQIDSPDPVGSCDVNPPSLESQRQSEQRSIAAANTKLSPLVAKLDSLESKIQQLNSAIQSQVESRNRFAAELKKNSQRTEELDLQISGNQQGRAALVLAVEKAERAVPAIATALEQATAANQILSDDSSLSQIVESLKNKHESLKSTVVNGRQELQATDATNDSLATERTSLEEATKSTEVELAETNQKLLQLENDVQPLRKQLQQLKNQIDALSKKIKSHHARVAHCTREIQFTNELKKQQEQLLIARQSVSEKEQELVVAKQKLETAQTEFQQHQDEKSALETKAAEIDSAIRNFRKRNR